MQNLNCSLNVDTQELYPVALAHRNAPGLPLPFGRCIPRAFLLEKCSWRLSPPSSQTSEAGGSSRVQERPINTAGCSIPGAFLPRRCSLRPFPPSSQISQIGCTSRAQERPISKSLSGQTQQCPKRPHFSAESWRTGRVA